MQAREERTWGVLTHLAGIIGLFIISSVGNIIATLVIWLIKRDESSFLNHQGKEALNFQITVSLVTLALHIIYAVTWGMWSFGQMFWHPGFGDWRHFSWNAGGTGLVWLLNVIFSIIAATRANNGIAYTYPLSLRLVK